MQVKVTVPAQVRRGPVRVALGDAAGWFGEGGPVIEVDTTACLSADDLVAALFLGVPGFTTEELADCPAADIRALVGSVIAVEGLDRGVWSAASTTASRWCGMDPSEREFWVLCASRAWEAFGLPGAAPTRPDFVVDPSAVREVPVMTPSVVDDLALVKAMKYVPGVGVYFHGELIAV